MTRSLRALGFASFLVLAAGVPGGTASAKQPPGVGKPAWAARPAQVRADEWKGDPKVDFAPAQGYFIWQDDNGWHVRWTTKGKKVRFEGSVEADGKIEQFEAVSADKKDLIRRVGNDEISFSTRTQAGVDGFNFRLSKGVDYLQFNLTLDGRVPDRTAVKLGSKKLNPPGGPFVIDRRPDSKKEKGDKKQGSE
jgi:hypothetical protein